MQFIAFDLVFYDEIFIQHFNGSGSHLVTHFTFEPTKSHFILKKENNRINSKIESYQAWIYIYKYLKKENGKAEN